MDITENISTNTKHSVAERLNASRIGKRFHKLQKICCFTALCVTAGWVCFAVALTNSGKGWAPPFALFTYLFWAVGILSCLVVAPIRTNMLIYPLIHIKRRLTSIFSGGSGVPVDDYEYCESGVFGNFELGSSVFVLSAAFIVIMIDAAVGVAIPMIFPATITIKKYRKKIKFYDTVIQKKQKHSEKSTGAEPVCAAVSE